MPPRGFLKCKEAVHSLPMRRVPSICDEGSSSHIQRSPADLNAVLFFPWFHLWGLQEQNHNGCGGLTVFCCLTKMNFPCHNFFNIIMAIVVFAHLLHTYIQYLLTSDTYIFNYLPYSFPPPQKKVSLLEQFLIYVY